MDHIPAVRYHTRRPQLFQTMIMSPDTPRPRAVFARAGEDSWCPIRLRRWFSHRLIQTRTSTAHASRGKYLWLKQKRHHVSVRCG
jgi:hypothetical protein